MVGIYAIGSESKVVGQQSQISYRGYYCTLKLHIYPWGQGEEAKEELSLSHWLLDNKRSYRMENSIHLTSNCFGYV